VETDATSGRAKRVKSSVPAVNTSAGSVEERLATPKPVVVPGQSDAAVVGDNNGDDRDNVEGEQEAEEEEEEEQEYEQNKDEVVKPSTRRPPASVVTAPLPGIPLETVFKAASEPTEAPCVAIKAGIRFTFGYLNVSSGKVRSYIICCGSLKEGSRIENLARRTRPEHHQLASENIYSCFLSILGILLPSDEIVKRACFSN
jgi:hypothetical protein